MLEIDLAPLLELERGRQVFDTGLTYGGLTAVQIGVTKRGGQLEISDLGGAVRAAEVDVRRLTFDDTIALGECSVNVGRAGTVWLPVRTTASESWLERVPDLVTEGSLTLYESLLALEE